MNLEQASTQYFLAPVTAAVDPTSDVVEFCFLAPGTEPTGATPWITGSWAPGPPYVAQVLIGPANGGTVLAVGTYYAWIRIQDNPEVPVQPVGPLTIY